MRTGAAHLKSRWVLAGLGAVVVALLVGVAVGPTPIPLSHIVGEVTRHLPFIGGGHGLDAQQATIVGELRLPRVVLALLVGAMLAGAGASYQGVFRNPLADPYLLGAAAGAGLAVTIVIAAAPSLSGGGLNPLPLAAFVGALGAVLVAYLVGRASGGASTASLLLAGVAVASFLTAVQTYVQQQHTDTIREVYSWILGRLTTAGWSDVILLLPYFVVTTVILLAHRRVLDVLAVGDAEATTLGISAAKARVIIVVTASFATAATVSVSGLIGFVGIIVPHTVRLLTGPSYRTILPLSLLFGAAFLAFADLAARTVAAPGEIPIGLVTAFVGAPFFILVLRSFAAGAVVSGVAALGVVVEHGTRRVLDGVDLVVEPGEWVTVVGPNGAGKTTLLHVIAGIVAADAGTIDLDGRDGARLRPRERARLVALVPQVPVVPPAIRVLDYVLLGRTPHLPFLGTGPAADLARAHDTLALLGLTAFAERRVETLSGGERQRVLLARALLQEPRVLLLDEPTSALDIGHQQDVLELIDALRHDHGLTVVSTLHDLTLAGLYADRLVLLADGRVVDRGSAAEVLTPDRLRRHFGAHVTVLHGEDGPVVVPHRAVRSVP